MNKLSFSKLSIFDYKFSSVLPEEEKDSNKFKNSEDRYKSEYTRFLKLKTESNPSLESDDTYKTPEHMLDELERDLGTQSDDEIDGMSDDLSPAKSSSSIKKNSMLNFSSPRFEGVSWKKKFGSFMSESGHPLEQEFNKKRVSLLDIVNEARNKKRNSDIYGLKPKKLMLNKLSRKSMFDLIQRSSLKLGKDISIIKTISTKVENSQSSEFHTPRSSFSGMNVLKPAAFGLHLNEVQKSDDIKSEAEDVISDKEEPNEGIIAAESLEKFLKLSIFKYDGRVFQDLDPVIASLNQLREANMIDAYFNEDGQNKKVLPGLIDNSEMIISKSNSRDQVPPFYLFKDGGLAKSTFYKNNTQVGVKATVVEKNPNNVINVHDIDDVEPEHLRERYQFLISQDSGSTQEKNYFTITTVSPNIFSHFLPESALKVISQKQHFQINYSFNTSPGNCQGQKSSTILIKDSFSKKGTFVKLKKDNPIALREGCLFMSTSNLGFFIKRISDQPVPEQAIGFEPLSQAYEIICVNNKTADKDLLRFLLENFEGPDSLLEKRVGGLQRLEYERLLQTKQIPHMLVEIVRWNENMEYYEEIGFVYVIYNNESLQNPNEDKIMKITHGKRNFINLNETSKTMQRIMPRNLLNYDITMGYDDSQKLWYLDLTEDAFNKSQEDVKVSESYCTNLEFGENKQDNLDAMKIKRGLNLLSGGRESTERGVWMSVSQLNILQEKFEGGWVEVGNESLIMFGDTIFKANIEELYTL